MINITICDDESAETAYLRKLAEEWAEARKIILRLSDYASAESFLFAYEDDKSADILLLDVQMAQMDGLALARRIRQDNKSVQIIFITGFPDYMAEGYEVAALHYLIKPVKADKLFDVLDRALSNLAKQEVSLLLDVDGENVRLAADEIIYIEALDHILEIHTARETLAVKMPLYKIESSLGEDFIKTHRSYIVNMRCLRKITRTAVILDSGQELPLSRRLYTAVNKAMMRYIKGGGTE